MKDDLKNISLGIAIYLGLLIIGTVWFFAYWIVTDRYPILDSLVRIFGVIFYFVIFGYAFVRWLIKKKSR